MDPLHVFFSQISEASRKQISTISLKDDPGNWRVAYLLRSHSLLWKKRALQKTFLIPNKVRGEDNDFPHSRAEDGSRKDETITPIWRWTDRVCPPMLQSCIACQGCLYQAAASRQMCCEDSELNTDLLPCASVSYFWWALLFWFAVANQHFFLCLWNSRSAGSLALELLFPRVEPVWAIIALQSPRPLCFLWHQHFPAVAVAVHYNSVDVLYKPWNLNNKSNVFFSVVSAFVVSKY